jgi:hypothetical protein
MPHITLDIPSENIPLLMEVVTVMGLETERVVGKNQGPMWHQYVLKEREEKYNSGKVSFASWQEIEKKMNDGDIEG